MPPEGDSMTATVACAAGGDDHEGGGGLAQPACHAADNAAREQAKNQQLEERSGCEASTKGQQQAEDASSSSGVTHVTQLFSW
jgi:hypothetical protein